MTLSETFHEADVLQKDRTCLNKSQCKVYLSLKNLINTMFYFYILILSFIYNRKIKMV